MPARDFFPIEPIFHYYTAPTSALWLTCSPPPSYPPSFVSSYGYFLVSTKRAKAVTMQPAIRAMLTENPGIYFGALLEGQIYDPLRVIN
jgi:hypothetical protein